MECSFYFEVLAPDGFVGIEQPLSESGLGLFVYHSHFNNKNILKSDNELIELGMDTSTTEIVHGSGILYCDFEKSVALARTLSEVFKATGYKHKIGVDDENGNNTIWISHNYS